jgi:hypothetical protein
LFSATFPPETAKSFFFMNIPGSFRSFPQRAFVFNNIPALFLQFSKSMVLWQEGGNDILHVSGVGLASHLWGHCAHGRPA